MDVGCYSINAVDQTERVVDTGVHFHAKVPLISFLGLVHLEPSNESIA